MSLTKIGRYQILEKLGQGAMGVVYRALDPNIGREVAIKTILLDRDDAESVERFRREAQAAGMLSHPNIVTIYDADQDEGTFYIAMELVLGETLQQMIARGPVPVEETIAFVEQIGSALDYAHGRKIIHRDIKPANIMVAQGQAQGQVKVMDFGMAKITTRTTRTGTAFGTPAYVSPEQAKGVNVDGRTDIFSLGAMMYEMLTGVLPFEGEHITTIIYKVMSEEPAPPTAMNSSLHPGLDRVVMKALTKDPAERYQNGQELVADLRNYKKLGAWQPRKSAPAIPSPRSVAAPLRRKKALVALVGGVVLAVAAGVYLQMQPGTEPQGMAPQQQQVSPTPPPSPPPQPAAPVGAEQEVLSQPKPDPSPPAAKSPVAPKRQRPAPATRASEAPPPPPSLASEPVAPAQQSPVVPNASPVAPQAPIVPQGSGAAGRVVIHTQPQGARILINGAGTSYRSPVNFSLAAGKYRITVERRGFQTETREIEVRGNRTVEVQMDLKPETERRSRLPFR